MQTNNIKRSNRQGSDSIWKIHFVKINFYEMTRSLNKWWIHNARAFFVLKTFVQFYSVILTASQPGVHGHLITVRADVRESLVKAWTQNESLSSNASFKTPRRRSSYCNSSLRNQCQHRHQVRHHLSTSLEPLFLGSTALTQLPIKWGAVVKRNFLVHVT